MTAIVTPARQLRPAGFRALDDALDAAAQLDVAGLLTLARARIRQLFGGHIDSDDPKVNAVSDYARSEAFDDVERLALEFTEQYVLDVAAMPDDLVAALHDRLGAERLYGFVMGLYAVDQSERLLVSTVVHPEVSR